MIPTLCFVLVLLLATVALASVPDEALDIERMVDALKQVENWDGRSRGAAGERGPWQITPAVWAQFSDKPFTWADSFHPTAREEQRRVARAYVLWIQRRLVEARFPASAQMVGLVWGAGWDAVFYGRPHRPSKAKRDYAQRAANLYYDLAKKAESTPLFKIEKANPSAPAPLPRQRP